MNTPKTHIRMTSDEYLALPDDGKHYELHEGELIEMPSATYLHHWIMTEILVALKLIAKQHASGAAGGDSLDFILNEGMVLRPDAFFVVGQTFPLPSYPRQAPDLAVEIMSPSNTPDEMLYKINMYFKYGSRLVWIVYPNNRQVAVCRKSDDGYITTIYLTEHDTLSGEDVLPDLTIPIASLFPPQA